MTISNRIRDYRRYEELAVDQKGYSLSEPAAGEPRDFARTFLCKDDVERGHTILFQKYRILDVDTRQLGSWMHVKGFERTSGLHGTEPGSWFLLGFTNLNANGGCGRVTRSLKPAFPPDSEQKHAEQDVHAQRQKEGDAPQLYHSRDASEGRSNM